MKNAFENIYILLNRNIEKMERRLTADTKKTAQSAALLAKDFIDENCLQDVSLEVLSQIAYLSPQHLIRQFKLLTGYSPHQYLTRVRIQTAAINLLQRENTIRQIGELSGYNEPHTFISAFKKLIGLTPQQFREKYQLNPTEGIQHARLLPLKHEKDLLHPFSENSTINPEAEKGKK